MQPNLFRSTSPFSTNGGASDKKMGNFFLLSARIYCFIVLRAFVCRPLLKLNFHNLEQSRTKKEEEEGG
jgi:hypothetical protein